jgi:hypothetical protein
VDAIGERHLEGNLSEGRLVMFEWLLELQFDDEVRYNKYSTEELARDALAYHDERGRAKKISLYKLNTHLEKKGD